MGIVLSISSKLLLIFLFRDLLWRYQWIHYTIFPYNPSSPYFNLFNFLKHLSVILNPLIIFNFPLGWCPARTTKDRWNIANFQVNNCCSRIHLSQIVVSHFQFVSLLKDILSITKSPISLKLILINFTKT